MSRRKPLFPARSPFGEVSEPASRRRWIGPYAAAMLLIVAAVSGWVLAVTRWPWQVIVILLGVAVVAFWRAVPKSHDDDGAVL